MAQAQKGYETRQHHVLATTGKAYSGVLGGRSVPKTPAKTGGKVTKTNA